MKTNLKANVLTALTGALLLTACGEAGTPQERAEAAFERLTEACANQQGDYSGAEGLVLYTGSDADRKYKDFASADGQERQMLNSACYQISSMMRGGDGYTIEGYEAEAESEGTWHVLNVNFNSGESAQVAFLDLNGQMGLGDID